MNKPNKQTVVLQSGVNVLLGELPISKLPKLGGKFGKNIGMVFLSLPPPPPFFSLSNTLYVFP
jgi:hypothetical protein